MINRPLIPTLFLFIGGILIGHFYLPHQPLTTLLVSFFIILLLATSFLVSSTMKYLCVALIFLLVGTFIDLKEHNESDLLKLAQQRQRVTIEGTVLVPPRIDRDVSRFDLRADRVILEGREKAIGENIRVTIYNNPGNFSPGEKVLFPARLRPFKNFNNPGRYDYELAMSLKGIVCGASVSDGRRIVPLGKGWLGFTGEFLERVRRPIRNFLNANLSAKNLALFQALILGEKQNVTPEIREPFNKAGLGHILAVSGLHIGLVAWLAFFLVKGAMSLSYNLTLQIDIRKIAAIMTIIPVVAYTFLVGFQVSGQRAMIMALVYLLSIILGKEKEAWSTLGLAALLILAIDPHAFLSISFQLSFGAVVGILWLAPPIFRKIPSLPGENNHQNNFFNLIYRYFKGLVAITISATIVLLPITLFYFHRISLVSIPANLTVVPLLGLWVLPLGLLSALVATFFPLLGVFILKLGAFGMDGMIKTIEFWADLPGSAIWAITPNVFEMLLFYCILFFILFLKRFSRARLCLLAVLLLLTADIAYWTYKTQFNRHLKVTYLDVGQGNAAFIQFPGNKRMLIDGGGFSRGGFDTGRMIIAPFLLHSKIRRIDYLVLTHPQTDHMNGLRFMAEHFHPEEFWHNGTRAETSSFRELMEIIESEGAKTLSPSDLKEGRDISGVRIDLLNPLKGKGFIRPNNNSLVLKFSYAGKSFLFTGDIEGPAEEAILTQSGPLLKSDIMLAPHHGSRYSSSLPFLKTVKPKLCVVSSGKGNYFGFPHYETTERYKKINCDIVRIDKLGAVQITAGKNHFKVITFGSSPD